MKALVLGFGMSGKSAAALLKKRGIEVEVCDDALCSRPLATLKGFDLFVPSPGIPPSHPLYLIALREGISIAGEVELFLQTCPNRCIGVTGTNGKTTAVEMVTHGLLAAGIPAMAVGNNGFPLCNVDPSALCVIELSSAQLETMQAPKLEIGVVLNITSDHCDRYPSFAAYATTKCAIGRCIQDGGRLFVHRSILPHLSHHLTRPFEPFAGGSREAAEIVLWALGISDVSVLERLGPLPHRLEPIGTVEGVTFINDSKATNVDATLYALERVRGPRVLILGGRDKGLVFEKLLPSIGRETQVVVYGEAREKIANALQPLTVVHVVETLEGAVEKAKALAPIGGHVLLSPGCSSFDAFGNYKERGEAFKRYVRGNLP